MSPPSCRLCNIVCDYCYRFPISIIMYLMFEILRAMIHVNHSIQIQNYHLIEHNNMNKP